MHFVIVSVTLAEAVDSLAVWVAPVVVCLILAAVICLTSAARCLTLVAAAVAEDRAVPVAWAASPAVSEAKYDRY